MYLENNVQLAYDSWSFILNHYIQPAKQPWPSWVRHGVIMPVGAWHFWHEIPLLTVGVGAVADFPDSGSQCWGLVQLVRLFVGFDLSAPVSPFFFWRNNHKWKVIFHLPNKNTFCMFKLCKVLFCFHQNSALWGNFIGLNQELFSSQGQPAIYPLAIFPTCHLVFLKDK